MEEGIKNKIILVLIVLTASLLVITVGSCNDSRRQKKVTQEEISTRMDLEAKLGKFTREKANLENSLKACQQAMEEKGKALESTQEALSQERLINKSLKSELEKVRELKETLEKRPGV